MIHFLKGALLLLGVLLAPLLHAEDARSIMKQTLDRETGASEVSRVTLTTCRTVKRAGKLACAETPRVKRFDSVRLDVGPAGEDSRSLMVIREPADERGIGFLQYDYDAAGKDSDQWMYLAALGKVKRIVAGDEDEPKTGSFFGSEIGYEDLSALHLEDFTYRLLKEATYRGRSCWIVESRPTDAYAPRSNYSRSIQWIDQERNLTLKLLLYDRQDQPVKQILMTEVEPVEGIWVARKMLVFNVQTRRQTTMALEAVRLNLDIPEALLTQRALTDAAFREGHLNALMQRLP